MKLKNQNSLITGGVGASAKQWREPLRKRAQMSPSQPARPMIYWHCKKSLGVWV